MARADWLAIIAIILTFIFGVPGLVSLFSDASFAVLSFVGLLISLLGTVIVFGYWFYQVPPWTILLHHSHLIIKDEEGKRGIYRKTVKLRSQQFRNQYYTFRDLGADGEICNFRAAPNVSIYATDLIAGDYHVTVKFPAELQFLATTETWLECDLLDSFLSKHEGTVLIVDMPIKKARIDVILPEARPPKQPTTVFRGLGREKILLPPKQNPDNELHWELSRRFGFLKRGDYEIKWHW